VTRKTPVLATVLAVLAVVLGIVAFVAKPPKPVLPPVKPRASATAPLKQSPSNASQNNVALATNTPTTVTLRLNRARELIRALREAASKTTDVQVFCAANGSALEELRSLGADAVTACLAEIADRTAPAPLRILLIEIASTLNGRSDPRLGQTLMSLINDPTEVKSVRMQALQWIPETADTTAGITLLEMLLKERDVDCEFGITRAMQGFKVPGSVAILKHELGNEKGQLIRIAASHAIAAQGGQEALGLLQASLLEKVTGGYRTDHQEEDGVTLHTVLALGEIPDVGSIPILQRVLKDSGNSVSVRNKAAETIGTIGGSSATQVLRDVLMTESNESVLVYIGRGLEHCGSASDAPPCVQRATTVLDNYTQSELNRVAGELQRKGTK